MDFLGLRFVHFLGGNHFDQMVSCGKISSHAPNPNSPSTSLEDEQKVAEPRSAPRNSNRAFDNAEYPSEDLEGYGGSEVPVYDSSEFEDDDDDYMPGVRV